MIDGHSSAQRLEGYLLAVSALRDDGTRYSCIYLGPAAPQDSLPELCRLLRLSLEVSTLKPIAARVPVDFEQWLLHRIRPMSADDCTELDPRLVNGFTAELVDILGGTPEWFKVQRSSGAANVNMGAIFDVFVFGRTDASFAVHCSWDS